jgi:hypothetical protein
MYPELVLKPNDSEEMHRMKMSYKESQLTEEERLAIIEKYGPPTAPFGSYRSIFLPPNPRKKGGGAA